MLFYRMYKKIKSILFYIKLLYNSTKFYYSTGRLKNGILWKNSHNYPQTCNFKCWGCFGKFRIFTTVWALRFSKLKKNQFSLL